MTCAGLGVLCSPLAALLKHGNLWAEANAVISAGSGSYTTEMSPAMADLVSQLHRVRTFIKDEQKKFKVTGAYGSSCPAPRSSCVLRAPASKVESAARSSAA
jgi:hypothetical protein